MESILISSETYFFSMLIITYITQKLLKVYKEKLFDDIILYTSNILVFFLLTINGSIVFGGSGSFFFFSVLRNDFLILGESVIFIWHFYIFMVLCKSDKYKNIR